MIQKRRLKESIKVMIGIGLCSFLVTFVFSVGNSIIQSKQRNQMKIYGEQVGITSFLTQSQRQEIEENTFWNRYGYVTSIGAVNPIRGNSELAIGYMDEIAWEMSQLQLLDGRMPTQRGEIVIEESFARRIGYDDGLKVGEKISLTIHSLNQIYPITTMREETTMIEESIRVKEFQVVGIVQEYVSDWYDALRGAYGVQYYIPISGFVSKEEAKDFQEISSIFNGVNGFLYSNQKDINSIWENLPTDVLFMANNKVYPTELKNGSVDVTQLDTNCFVAVISLILLISMALFVSSILLSSVDAERKRLALLRTVGATKSQIWKGVLIEHVWISVIGSSIGSLLGMGGAALAVSTAYVPLHFYGQPWIPFGTSALCVAITLIAALFPAIKASRMPILEGSAAGKRRKHNKIQEDTLLSTSFFIKNSLKDSKFRVGIYVISFALCISLIHLVKFYVNINISDLEMDRNDKNDFVLGTHGFGHPTDKFAENEIDVSTDLDTVSILEECKEIEGVYFVSRDTFSIAFLSLERENISEYIRKSRYKEYGFNPEIRIYDETALETLEDSIIEGNINIDALQKGEEIILCLPPFWCRAEDEYGFKYYSYNDGVVPRGAVYYENTSMKVGDILTVTTNPGNLDMSKTVQVKVGAIVDAKYAMDIITVEGALEVLEIPYFTSYLRVFMEEGADLEKAEKEMMRLSEDYQTMFYSNLQHTKRMNDNILFARLAGGMLSMMLAVIGLVVYIYTTVIRFRHRVKEMNMLRIVGMTKAQCMKVFSLEGVLYGILIGAASLVIVITITAIFEPYRLHKFLPVPSLMIGFVVSIFVSVVIPWFWGRKMLKGDFGDVGI